jgi:hypothetical protein
MSAVFSRVDAACRIVDTRETERVNDNAILGLIPGLLRFVGWPIWPNRLNLLASPTGFEPVLPP